VTGVQTCALPILVADPELRLQEHLGTVQARGAQTLPHLPFVAVGGGGVDVPVPGLESGGHGAARVLWGGLEDAQTDGRDGDGVVQSESGHDSTVAPGTGEVGVPVG